jgi:hypothetical protein
MKDHDNGVSCRICHEQSSTERRCFSWSSDKQRFLSLPHERLHSVNVIVMEIQNQPSGFVPNAGLCASCSLRPCDTWMPDPSHWIWPPPTANPQPHHHLHRLRCWRSIIHFFRVRINVHNHGLDVRRCLKRLGAQLARHAPTLLPRRCSLRKLHGRLLRVFCCHVDI